MSNTYKCAYCQETFQYADESEWSEEDRINEYKKLHPGHSVENIASEVLCDDCFQLYLKWKENLERHLDKIN